MTMAKREAAKKEVSLEPRRDWALGLSVAGFHGIAYRHWGPRSARRTLICVHGLTRNGRDFDVLAQSLAAEGWRVACPDVVGRGDSDWLRPTAEYSYPQYLADLAAVIGQLQVGRLDWLGTSMGGLIGLMLAALPGTPIERLILNDVGPFIPKAALERLAGYVGRDPRFEGLDSAEAYIRRVHAPFGRLSDAQWRAMTKASVRPADGGGFRLAYDPRIGEAFRKEPLEDLDLWAIWDGLRLPTLVLRGAESDLLLPDTAKAMTERGPMAELIEFPGCGHAPALLDPVQIAAVGNWLSSGNGMGGRPAV